MYILENTMFKRTLISLSTVAFLTACSADVPVNDTQKHNTNSDEIAVDGGKKYETKNGSYTQYKVNTQNVKSFGHFREATKREITAWDVDVRPDGVGLPEFDMKDGEVVLENGKPKKAQGSVGWGNELYDAKCSMCHGDFGSGGQGGYPALSGGDIETLSNQLQNPADKEPGQEPPVRRIGSYWPYASTLFWYIQDSMPFPHPKSLTNSETYAIAAYLLSENEITIDGEEMDEDFVMDKEQFKKIVMPNVKNFYPKVDTPKNPKQGVKNVTNYLSNTNNYGAGTRCMTNCIKGEVPVLRIKNELTDMTPPASTAKDLPAVKKTGKVHPGKAGYEATCVVCHGNPAIGAPVVGDAEAWGEVTKKGLDAVYHNAINGINGMPPRGGNMELSDDDMKNIINYMIESSK